MSALKKNEHMFSARVGLVPALDVDSMDAVLRVVEQTSRVEGVAGYKLGLAGSLRVGLAAAIQAIRGITDLPVVYDHQKAGPDMPDMAGKFAAICAEARADALILFPVAGPQATRSFVGETIKRGMTAIVGGHIPVPDYVISGGGHLVDDVIHRIVMTAAQVGAHHFVLPANDVELIRHHVEWTVTEVKDPVVFLTGFGMLGGKVEKAFAAAAGSKSRYAIVGRQICYSPSPADAARRFVDDMMAAAG